MDFDSDMQSPKSTKRRQARPKDDRWRRTIIKQKEQLKAHVTALQAAEAAIDAANEKAEAVAAENLELRAIIKAVQVLHISVKRSSEKIVRNNSRANELLRRVTDDGVDGQRQVNRTTDTVSRPNQAVLSETTRPAKSKGSSHTRDKSAVSSSESTSAPSITTSTSTYVCPRELRKRVHHLEDKMKGLLTTMKENGEGSLSGSQGLKHDVKHDSQDSGYGSLRLGESPRVSGIHVTDNGS